MLQGLDLVTSGSQPNRSELLKVTRKPRSQPSPGTLFSMIGLLLTLMPCGLKKIFPIIKWTYSLLTINTPFMKAHGEVP